MPLEPLPLLRIDRANIQGYGLETATVHATVLGIKLAGGESVELAFVGGLLGAKLFDTLSGGRTPAAG